jgi:hypothetical protein
MSDVGPSMIVVSLMLKTQGERRENTWIEIPMDVRILAVGNSRECGLESESTQQVPTQSLHRIEWGREMGYWA